MSFIRHVSMILALGLLGACTSVPRIVNEYKIDVQQGNVVTQEMVSQLKPGQTRDQVRFILGTPLLMDIFHANRWDYVYSLRKGSTGETETRQFSVFFDAEGKLARVAGDVAAAASSDATVPVNRMQELDLGSVGADATAPAPDDERGFFGKLFEKVGF